MAISKVTLIGIERYLNNQPIPESIFDNIALPVTNLLEKEELVNTILLECGEFESLYSDPAFVQFATKNFFVKHGRTFKKWADALAVEYRPLENYNRTETEEYEDDEFERTVYTEGKRKTTSNDGKTESTTDSGKTTTTTNNGKTTITNDAGKTTDTSTKPATMTSTNGYAGFSSAGSGLTTGTNSTSQIGTGSTYNETNTSEQIDAGTSVTEQNTPGTSTTEQLDPSITTVEQTADSIVQTEQLNDDIRVTTKKPRELHAYGNIGVTTSQQMLEAELKVAKFNIYSEISKLYMKELTIPVYL